MEDILDVNTLFGPLPVASNDLPVESLLSLMKKHGVSGACTLSTLGMLLDPAVGNAVTRAACGEHTELIPVATLNPSMYYGEPNVAAQLKSDGFRLVRFFPVAQEWPVDYVPFRDLIKALLAAKMPIMVDVEEPGVISGLANILDDFTSPVILAAVDTTMLAEAISALRQHSEWYVESSRLLGPGAILKIAETVGADRILFGTSAPSHPIASALNTLKYAGLADADRTKLLTANARRLLAI